MRSTRNLIEYHLVRCRVEWRAKYRSSEMQLTYWKLEISHLKKGKWKEDIEEESKPKRNANGNGSTGNGSYSDLESQANQKRNSIGNFPLLGICRPISQNVPCKSLFMVIVIRPQLHFNVWELSRTEEMLSKRIHKFRYWIATEKKSSQQK